MSIYENFRGGYLTQGQALGKNPVTVLLSADNQVVNPYSINDGYSMINLQSDSTTSTARTFTILNGQFDGHELTFVFTSAGSTTCELASAGNVTLVATWAPTVGESLTLLWNAQLGKWIQKATQAAAGSVQTSPTIRGTLLLQNTSGSQPILALSEDPDNGTSALKIVAPAALAADFDYTMSSVLFKQGLFTTVGGDATESITVTGALATDSVSVTVNTLGTGSRTVTAAIATTDAITVTMSGDPSSNHVLNYQVFRTVA